jgi:hypothetical protein
MATYLMLANLADQGIPNVYSINRISYWELPNGELSRTDPYPEKERAGR